MRQMKLLAVAVLLAGFTAGSVSTASAKTWNFTATVVGGSFEGLIGTSGTGTISYDESDLIPIVSGEDAGKFEIYTADNLDGDIEVPGPPTDQGSLAISFSYGGISFDHQDDAFYPFFSPRAVVNENLIIEELFFDVISGGGGDPFETAGKLVGLGENLETEVDILALFFNSNIIHGNLPEIDIGDFFAQTNGNELEFQIAIAAVPVPAALPLFLSGLAGLGFVGYRRRRKAEAAA